MSSGEAYYRVVSKILYLSLAVVSLGLLLYVFELPVGFQVIYAGLMLLFFAPIAGILTILVYYVRKDIRVLLYTLLVLAIVAVNIVLAFLRIVSTKPP